MLINGDSLVLGCGGTWRGRSSVRREYGEHAHLQLRSPGAQTKLVGSDSGRYERETFVDEVLLAPSERAVVDVLFDTPGEVHLEHRTPERTYDLGMFTVVGDRVSGAASSFDTLRVDPDLTAEHRSIQSDLEREPDKVLAFFSRMPLLYGGGTPTSYACPMHPDVTSLETGTCPKCGMTLTPVFAPSTAATSYACPMHPEVTSSEPGTCPECGMKLVAVEAAAPATYACPMHPEVTSTEPGTCPECGMKLVQTDARRRPLRIARCSGHAGQGMGMAWSGRT